MPTHPLAYPPFRLSSFTQRRRSICPFPYLSIDSPIRHTSLPLSRQSAFNSFANPPPAHLEMIPSEMQSKVWQGCNSSIHIILLDIILSRTSYTSTPDRLPLLLGPPHSLDRTSRLNLSRQPLLSHPFARAYPPIRQGVYLTADLPARLLTRLSLSLSTS